MRTEYHIQAIMACLEEAKKPRKYRMFSDEQLEDLIRIELEFWKQDQKSKVIVDESCEDKM
jgi:hypothetical protein